MEGAINVALGATKGKKGYGRETHWGGVVFYYDALKYRVDSIQTWWMDRDPGLQKTKRYVTVLQTDYRDGRCMRE